jgi:hypothetical protein
MRDDYAHLSDTTGKSSSSQTAASYQDVPLVIEYDGRIISDPPPGLAP